MPTIAFDGPGKVITVGYDGPITTLTAVDIYSRWKDWVAAGNAQHLPAFADSVGGNDLGGGVALGQYVFLRNDLGWRITGAAEDYEARIAGDLYPTDPNAAMFAPVAGQTVLFTVQRSIGSSTVSTGGGADPTSIAAAVWSRSANLHTGDTTMGGALNLARAILRNRTVTDPATGVMTVYGDDDVTPLLTANLWQDAAGATPYAGSGADRRDRLV